MGTHYGDNEWQERFNAVPFEDNGGTKQPRYYQELAVNRAVEAIANDKDRVLLTLATGTGKPLSLFRLLGSFLEQMDKQKDGKRQPRILFLADRNILANQAYLDFGAFDANALVHHPATSQARRSTQERKCVLHHFKPS